MSNRSAGASGSSFRGAYAGLAVTRDCAGTRSQDPSGFFANLFPNSRIFQAAQHGWYCFCLVVLISTLMYAGVRAENSTKPQETSSGFPVDVQWRRGFADPWRYPLAEIFIKNATDQAVEYRNVLLNGEVLQTQGNCTWTQFYPSAKALAGQTILLQICFPEASSNALKVQIEVGDGKRLVVELPPFPVMPVALKANTLSPLGELNACYDLRKQPFPVSRNEITGLTFSGDLQSIYIAYCCFDGNGYSAISNKTSNISLRIDGSVTNAASNNSNQRSAQQDLKIHPVAITINGKDYSGTMRTYNFRSRDIPRFGSSAGMIVLKLSEPASQGDPIHIQLKFSDGNVTQCLLRVWHGIFLDDFTLNEGVASEKMRNDLSLDLHPIWENIGGDPACADFHSGRPQYGSSILSILATRKEQFEARNRRLTYPYLCVASDQNTYAVYGQCADGIQVNPYCLEWEVSDKFIETESHHFRSARETAAPKPWFWIPETFCFEKKHRLMEPQEYRLLALAALGNAVKGIRYYIHHEKAPIIGYSKSPQLNAEISKMNAEIKKLQSILGPALFVSTQTIGEFENGCRQYSLWSGDQGVLTIIRNLDYVTDNQVNDLGMRPRFRFTPKTSVKVAIFKPAWIKEAVLGGGKLQVTDPLTGQTFPFTDDGDLIHLELTRLDLGQIIWIPTPKNLKPN